ncbi:thiamine pyrophosphate-dependent dehydrogenase E1 component subunit alpha [Bordetella petrii]|uniref:thiamine pyrophosphate-dependent dehydrogenase E1 component subunit alpha n=1 Tax=Bordetella petrii TaxID=94624 RepID=UPI001E40DDF5|nr:thiamine pyrophosphate-dependent dehydrogenase E1 component subunit alpha [Bordetella petrii]MCD0502293.1 thiamine pyrophosphate-dependent dehydrogenase E1 component subunit alpha [Bordetella petrii]
MATANKEYLLDVYQRMLRIRLVELRLGRLFADGEVPGFIHLSVGQEAVAAAMGVVLRREDTVASTHRGHGHALAKGIDVEDFFLELMAREEGICKGRGGSMHVANMSIGMLGANAIVGASIPIALGSALAHQVRRTNALAVAFFGDGAMAEGVLHESLNLASLWQLPLLFLCENNGWAEFSPTHKQFVAPLDKLSAAFSIPHHKVDGNDVLQVVDAARAAIDDIRAGQGPRVLECITHRWRGHYEGDPQKYRPSDEIDGLGEHDPVARFEAVLDKNGIKKARREQVLEAVQAQVEQAVERARNGRAPAWQAARDDVYTHAEGC